MAVWAVSPGTLKLGQRLKAGWAATVALVEVAQPQQPSVQLAVKVVLAVTPVLAVTAACPIRAPAA
jgi:hypothetical protein